MRRSKQIFAAFVLAIVIGTGLPKPSRAADYANPHLLVSSATLNDMLARDDVRIIDVRPKSDYDAGHILDRHEDGLRALRGHVAFRNARGPSPRQG